MKQKIITTVLILISMLAPLLITPVIINDSYNYYKIWVLLIGGALLLIMLILSYKTLKIDKKDILILIFLGLTFISTFLSSNTKISIFGQRLRHEGLLMFTTYVLIYLCSKKFFKHDNYKEVLNLLFYTYVLICIFGILQRHLFIKRLYPLFINMISGTFGNSNFFGSFITIVLPISVLFYLFKGGKKPFILSLLMFFSLISCTARSAWLAFVVCLVPFLIYLIKNKDKKVFKRLIILLICFILIFIYLFNECNIVKSILSKKEKKDETKTDTEVTIQQTETVQTNPETQTKNGSVLERINDLPKTQRRFFKTFNEIKIAINTGSLDIIGSQRGLIWRWTLKVISNKPFFGCGPDNLNNALHTYCKKEIIQDIQETGKDTDKAHNEILQIAATLGIPAAIIYITFVGLILCPNLKKMYKNPIIFGLTIAIIGYLVQAFFNISTIGVAPLFWMLLGLIDNKEFMENFKKSIA